MRSKKKTSPSQKPAKDSRPKKDPKAKVPKNFPAIGATMSSYSAAYTGTLAEPKPRLGGKAKWKKIAAYSAITLAVLALIYGSWVGFKLYRDFGGWSGIWSLLFPSKLKGEDTGHVNILLAGNSADDPGHNGANLTDSIMLVSINTHNNTALMFSIPRDLYVNIPGFGYSKINAAYEDGGMPLLDKVVSQDLGVTIDYDALIDYTAFRDAVNAVGGITVDINSPDGRLYDPSIDYYTNGPLVNLSNGEHTLNGQQALNLARARGDSPYSIGFEKSDFQRTADQRLMLVALEKKAKSVGFLANPVKVGDLFDGFKKNVHTDMTLGNIRRLYTITKPITNNRIKSATIPYPPLLASYDSYASGSALVPAAGINNYSAIQAYVQKELGP